MNSDAEDRPMRVHIRHRRPQQDTPVRKVRRDS